ncbi:olfactory receptor 5F1-like [Salvelinus namaycush]|uniref:Olfactory receptor 5F1-like n=1 Tax=Salvelinus namaycush TaxID=8040 RepID=A0A8U0P3P7_SALNM|nr:olfactory receptor 5F1-like [Salvelinus namaycush]
MENSTQVKLFYLFGLQETFNNKSVFFILSLITYLLIITVNLTLIITIIQEKGLHEPMYIFLCSLCVNGLYGTAGFYPKMLLDLQSDVQVISYGGCLTQAYVIYTFVICEMSTLTVMSYDRYVAICRPLLYHTIVTSLTIVRNCVKSAKGRTKFTQTCVPHLITIVIYITVTLFDTLQGWNNVNITLNMRNAMAVQFLVIPPVLNPVIYGLNLQQIRRAVFRKCNAHKIIDMKR